MKYPTPHIQAEPSDFAPVVLMPGDPLRSRFLAENYLDRATLVNNVRGVQGYTGYYHGTRVSVMASGMGMPSIAIYSHELYHAFGVETIIRIGSAGGLRPEVKVRDLVFGMGASTDSSFPLKQGIENGYPVPLCDYGLLRIAVEEAEKQNVPFHVGPLFSTDHFYAVDASAAMRYASLGAFAVEMEAAALYYTAQKAGKRALAVCTVSDHLLSGESLPAAERETSFTKMMEIALAAAVRVCEKQ